MALREAMAFGGIGQGIGQGLQNFVELLLEKNKRERQEQEAQALIALLPALLGQTGPTPAPPGAAMVPGEEAGRPQPEARAQTTTMPPEFQAITDAIRGTKIKDPATAQALLSLGVGLAGQRRTHEQGLAEEERKAKRQREADERNFQQALQLEGVRAGHERDIEKEKRTTALGDTVRQAVGRGRSLYPNIPIAQAEAAAAADPLGAMAFVEAEEKKRGLAARDRDVLTPDEIEANATTLRLLRDRLQKAGIKMSEQDIAKVSKNQKSMEPFSKVGASAEEALFGPRQRAKAFDWSQKFLMQSAIQMGREESKVAQAMRDTLTTIIKNRFTLQEFGEVTANDPVEVAKSLKDAKGFLQSVGLTPKEGEETRTALKVIEEARQAALAQASEPVSIPLPAVLAGKGVSEAAWQEFVSSYTSQGLTLLDAIRDGAKIWNLSEREVAQMVMQIAPR